MGPKQHLLDPDSPAPAAALLCDKLCFRGIPAPLAVEFGAAVDGKPVLYHKRWVVILLWGCFGMLCNYQWDFYSP